MFVDWRPSTKLIHSMRNTLELFLGIGKHIHSRKIGIADDQCEWLLYLKKFLNFKKIDLYLFFVFVWFFLQSVLRIWTGGHIFRCKLCIHRFHSQIISKSDQLQFQFGLEYTVLHCCCCNSMHYFRGNSSIEIYGSIFANGQFMHCDYIRYNIVLYVNWTNYNSR